MPPYRLSDIVKYFLHLGTTGFGGPVALTGYMHRDLVEKRQWITEEEYKTGLALAQLAPGPLAAQLGIYLGYVHYRLLGATLCGLAFVLPSFIMVVLLGMAYKAFGGLTWMQSVFYGVGSAVTGIIIVSCYKLTVKSIGKFNAASFRKNWLLWLFFVVAFAITVITKSENIFVFLGAGFIYMAYKSPPAFLTKNRMGLPAILLLQVGAFNFEPGVLTKIAVFFAKAGAFVFGSGLAIVPFLHSGVVVENHWLNEKQFVDAIAVAMITPGPVVITVGFIGYLVAGFAGASVAALATFLPCFLITVAVAPHFNKIAKNNAVKAFVDGVTAAVVGALAGAVVIIAQRSVVDFASGLIALATIFALIYFKEIKEPYIILVAALLGLLIKATV